MKAGKVLLALLLALLLAACTAAPQNETTQVPTETTEATVPTEPPRPAEETNILHQYILPPDTYGDGEMIEYVYDTPYLREQIKTVTIVDTLADAPEDCWDASQEQNGAVLVWVEPNGALFDLYIGAEGGVWAGECARNMFWGYTNVERIDFGDAFHTEGARDMYGMFRSCGSLRELDLGHFNTANVNNMGGMFAQCESLTALDLSSFRTPKLTQMIYMFDGCRSLTELDISNFDTSHVTDMGYLFRGCEALAELDLSHFDMSNVSGDYCTYKMFENCPAGSEWKHLQK